MRSPRSRSAASARLGVQRLGVVPPDGQRDAPRGGVPPPPRRTRLPAWRSRSRSGPRSGTPRPASLARRRTARTGPSPRTRPRRSPRPRAAAGSRPPTSTAHQVLELRPAVGLPDRPQHDLLPAPSAPTRLEGPATSGARHRPRLARGCDRRLDGPPPPGHLHHDRFRRQDGVVDQHAEGDDEGGQRHLIEADAEGPHHEERHDHRRHEARHH